MPGLTERQKKAIRKKIDRLRQRRNSFEDSDPRALKISTQIMQLWKELHGED